MARTGRLKAEKHFDHKVTVKFKAEEYQIMVSMWNLIIYPFRN